MAGFCVCLWHYIHSFVLWVFFRKITIVGENNIPDKGAVIIVGNHSGAAQDGILIFTKFKRFIRFVAKEALFKLPVFGCFVKAIGTVPVLRPVDVKDASQAASSINNMFDRVLDALREESAICIFPEGFSHDMSHLALDRHTGTFKYGTGEIAMLASSQNIDVKLVPVGIHYDDKTHIRSSVFVKYGAPISITPAEVAAYVKFKTDNPEAHIRDNTATVDLLPRLQKAVEEVWLNAPTHTVLQKAALAYEVCSGKCAKDAAAYDAEDYYEQARYYTALQIDDSADDKEVIQFNALLGQYHSELAEAGTCNMDVVSHIPFCCLAFQVIFYTILILILLPLLLPGLILLLPIRIAAHFISSTAASSIAKADVKKGLQPEWYVADDVVGTVKIMVGMFLSAILYPVYAGLACWQLDDWLGIPKVAWYFIALAAAIILSAISVLVLDQERDLTRSIRRAFKSCCCSVARRDELLELHDKLRAALGALTTAPATALTSVVQPKPAAGDTVPSMQQADASLAV